MRLMLESLTGVLEVNQQASPRERSEGHRSWCFFHSTLRQELSFHQGRIITPFPQPSETYKSDPA